LTKCFYLQIMEDYAKGGCKNGHLRHMDTNILDCDEAHRPGDQSLESELLGLLAPFFHEKASSLLQSR
jgi:CDK5 regulatory subunit-associated protein 2